MKIKEFCKKHKTKIIVIGGTILVVGACVAIPKVLGKVTKDNIICMTDDKNVIISLIKEIEENRNYAIFKEAGSANTFSVVEL